MVVHRAVIKTAYTVYSPHTDWDAMVEYGRHKGRYSSIFQPSRKIIHFFNDLAHTPKLKSIYDSFDESLHPYWIATYEWNDWSGEQFIKYPALKQKEIELKQKEMGNEAAKIASANRDVASQ
jgi:hypothetical protein